MSYLFPEGSTTERGVVEIGSNIDVLDGIISIPQSVAPTAAIFFDELDATSALRLDGKSVVTEITPTAGSGISITNLVGTGPDSSFTVNNTGVLSLVAGAGITLSASTGIITVSATGADFLNTIGVTNNYTATATDEYIGVNSTSLVTVTLPAGVQGRQYIIKEERGTGTGRVNVQGTGNETIDGSPFKQLTANASLTVVFRAGQWRII
jgi:hypothetical protein